MKLKRFIEWRQPHCYWWHFVVRADTNIADDFHTVTYGKGYFMGIGERLIFYSTNGITNLFYCFLPQQHIYFNKKLKMLNQLHMYLMLKYIVSFYLGHHFNESWYS